MHHYKLGTHCLAELYFSVVSCLILSTVKKCEKLVRHCIISLQKLDNNYFTVVEFIVKKNQLI